MSSRPRTRIVHLHVDLLESSGAGMTIQVRLGDVGVVVEAWQEDGVIGTASKTYDEMGVVVKEAPEQEDLPEGMVNVNGEIREDCAGFHHDD
jgi:hypothetical protein